MNNKNHNVPCTRKDPLLANQCVVINPNFDKLQEEASKPMTKTLTIYPSGKKPFPLQVWISPVEAVWKFGSGSYQTTIDGPGKYRYAMKKTTIKRLPAPYSRPSCIQKGSKDALEKNLFIGLYTRDKCEESCVLKLMLLECKAAYYFYRAYIRDKTYLNSFIDESIDRNEGTKCWDRVSRSNRYKIRACKATCYQPCEEERYTISETSHPWSDHQKKIQQRQTNHENMKTVRLSVYFSELNEIEIAESPSYDRVTLLANFGGMLGLMTGMSAISLLEILIWVLLSVIACVKHRMT